MIAAAVVDRLGIVVSSTTVAEDGREAYSVTIDGVSRGTVLLQQHYQPTIGVYGGIDVAIWGGCDLAFGSVEGDGFRQLVLPEPVHAVYRFGGGWLVVAEISVFVVDGSLAVKQRRIHNEVLLSSKWSHGVLVVHDFEGRVLEVNTDEREMVISDFSPADQTHT